MLINLGHTESTTLSWMLPKIMEETSTLTLAVDSYLLETTQIFILDSKIFFPLKTMQQDQKLSQLDKALSATEVETNTELELQQILKTMLEDPELSQLTEVFHQ